MKTIITCRECGHQENGDTEGQLMNRIKMWNHVERSHKDRHIQPSQISLVMREYSEIDLPQQKHYRLQPAH